MQVCAYKMSVLRKAITRMRKKMRVTGPKGNVALKELLLAHGDSIEGSTTALRKRWSLVSKQEHPPVEHRQSPSRSAGARCTSSAR